MNFQVQYRNHLPSWALPNTCESISKSNSSSTQLGVGFPMCSLCVICIFAATWTTTHLVVKFHPTFQTYPAFCTWVFKAFLLFPFGLKLSLYSCFSLLNLVYQFFTFCTCWNEFIGFWTTITYLAIFHQNSPCYKICGYCILLFQHYLYL